jgi:hypothetical protein
MAAVEDYSLCAVLFGEDRAGLIEISAVPFRIGHWRSAAAPAMATSSSAPWPV